MIRYANCLASCALLLLSCACGHAGAASAADARNSALVPIRRTVVVPDQGYFPVALKLRDGRLAVVLRGGAAHLGIGGRLDLIVSSDQGRSWSRPRVVVDSPVDDRNPAFGQAPNGDLVVAFWRTARYDDQGRYAPHLPKPVNTWVTRSHDGGQTWSEPAAIEVSDIGWGSPYGRILTLPDGSMLMNIYGGPVRQPGQNADEQHNHAYVYRSTDSGRTWQRWGCPGPGNFNETALLRLADGRLLAAMRSEPDGQIWLCQSQDGGRTWNTAKQVTPSRVHPADMLALDDGRLVMTVGYRAGPYGVAAMLSGPDATFNWDRHHMLVDDLSSRDCGYPSSVSLGDGRILTVFYAVGLKNDQSIGTHCGAVEYQITEQNSSP